MIVVACIHQVVPRLLLAAYHAAAQYAAAVRAVQEEGGESQDQQVSRFLLSLHLALRLPGFHRHRSVLNPAAQFLRVVQHGVPEGEYRAVLVVDLDVSGIALVQQTQGHARTSRVWLDVRATLQVVHLHQAL